MTIQSKDRYETTHQWLARKKESKEMNRIFLSMTVAVWAAFYIISF